MCGAGKKTEYLLRAPSDGAAFSQSGQRSHTHPSEVSRSAGSVTQVGAQLRKESRMCGISWI